MFGLTKREQRWKAEEKAAELYLGLISTTVKAAAAVRIADAQADADELARLKAENAALLGDLLASTKVINMQLQTIKELEAQIAAKEPGDA